MLEKVMEKSLYNSKTKGFINPATSAPFQKLNIYNYIHIEKKKIKRLYLLY